MGQARALGLPDFFCGELGKRRCGRFLQPTPCLELIFNSEQQMSAFIPWPSENSLGGGLQPEGLRLLQQDLPAPGRKGGLGNITGLDGVVAGN